MSDIVVNRLPSEIFRLKTALDSQWTEAIVSAYIHLDTLLREIAVAENSGSCAVTAVVEEENVILANSGDSRALLIDSEAFNNTEIVSSFDGEDSLPSHTSWVTDEHSADNPEEQSKLRLLHPNEKDVIQCRQKIIELDSTGQIVASQWVACYVKGRLQPTRAFGHFSLKDPPYIQVSPSTRIVKRMPGSALVLGSDGLWDYLSPGDVLEVVKRGIARRESPDQIADALIDKALTVAAEAAPGGTSLTLEKLRVMQPGVDRRNIHDDITVVVVLV